MRLEFLPIRLTPGEDLRGALEGALRHQSTNSAFVVSGIGSLSEAKLRFAGEAVESAIAGPLLPDGSLTRELDAATGFNELVVHRRP